MRLWGILNLINFYFEGGFFLYATLFRMPPLRFHFVGGCWDLTQDDCLRSSVPDPDPHVFGSPVSGPISQRYGSWSFHHQAKIVRNTLIPSVLRLLLAFLSLKNDENVPSRSDKQKNCSKKLVFSQRHQAWIRGSAADPGHFFGDLFCDPCVLLSRQPRILRPFFLCWITTLAITNITGGNHPKITRQRIKQKLIISEHHNFCEDV
jgi:hypothetical protein